MYSNKTKYYGLPYPSKSEFYDSEAMALLIKKLDSVLYASNYGLSKALFGDSPVEVVEIGQSSYMAVLKPVNDFSVVGILRSRLFYSSEHLVFDNLKKGLIYYLYVAYIPRVCDDPTAFVRGSTTSYSDSPDRILLAVVDLRGDVPVINNDPEGKVYASDVRKHATDFSSPHGENLEQKNLNVECLTIKKQRVLDFIYVSTITNGLLGSVVELDFEPLFVHYTAFGDAGNVWFTLNKNNIVVYNSGNPNILLKLKIEGKNA